MSKLMDVFQKMYFNALDNRPDLMGNAPDPRKKKEEEAKQAEAVTAPAYAQSIPIQQAPQQPTCIIIQQPMAMPQNQAFVVPEGYRLVREDEFEDNIRRTQTHRQKQKQQRKQEENHD